MTIGERLRSTRETRGLSQGELGKLTKIHRMQISKYENNGAVPSAEILKKLVKVLQVSADYLLFDGQRKETVEFNDPTLKEQFLLVDKMDKEERKTIKSLIDAYITKNQIKSMVNK